MHLTITLKLCFFHPVDCVNINCFENSGYTWSNLRFLLHKNIPKEMYLTNVHFNVIWVLHHLSLYLFPSQWHSGKDVSRYQKVQSSKRCARSWPASVLAGTQLHLDLSGEQRIMKIPWNLFSFSIFVFVFLFLLRTSFPFLDVSLSLSLSLIDFLCLSPLPTIPFPVQIYI